MKICNVCGINKDDTCYSATYGKTGKRYLTNTCKECLKAKRRKKPVQVIKNTEIKTIEKKVDMINFTDKEILEVVLNKDKRIHTVFNLDKDMRDKIKELADKKKLNMSDAANLIFRKFFENGN
jgi:ribosome biogenesis protein Nip4